MSILLIVLAIFDPYYGQVTLTWTQESDVRTVLVGKFDKDGVWSVIRIHEESRRGPQRTIDYSPHIGDRYAIAECEAVGADLNVCHWVARDILARRPVMYLPFIHI